MLKNFQEHINLKLDFLKESKLLIAISGGIDSVVLTHLCAKTNFNISLAHCNFNLRGKESDADEDFILKLAENLNLEVFIQNFSTEDYANEKKLSIQMAARELRYHWFVELAEQLNFDYILTAHHADDNLETFLINLTRGTGLDGLTGIPEINDKIVRPLLKFSREHIEAYAKDNNLNWREDSSNASTKYVRNKLRHEVIPNLKEINSQLLQSFNNTLQHLKDVNEIVEDRIEAVSDDVVKHISKSEIHYNIAEIQKLNNPKAYLYELLKDYNFNEWDDVLNLLKAQSGKFITSDSHRLLKDREKLILSKKHSDNYNVISISEVSQHIEIPIGRLNLELVKQIEETGISSIYVDKDLLKFPLYVRQWEKGDYFYPFGMHGKKKLSKYFKDEKLSLLEKENTWLLCSENDIVWIINKRLDNRFKITEATEKIVKITLQ
ncbi:tRNA lysidine(34) synthetase TilS [Yeosuana sp. MJ-SS3]|uniref:tRNA(Ile)-lysidine synthase n=1 Tax=Gilvirhabdus luticola TaxID=3079858 RepID=A0ABU3U7B4_9FLAO|nr:tRNA lysidine(34) synthetase TilS [Yeosuana sp. MJ-SS3]MDU8886280.1 tRNA lysidine(34) synthetase TilS [Yeosuana sp. MJ-SS3]